MANVPVIISVTNGVGSARPDIAEPYPGDTITWSLSPGSTWSGAPNHAIHLPNLTNFFPDGLSFANGAIQGTLSSTITGGSETGYTVNVNSGTGDDEEEITLDFCDENGISFDPKIKVKMPTEP